ncbi:MAG: hypothetical protein KAI84_16335, partial [Gammaproteobacteria bacterium]|nr:hypothetical protein [Gammaproteobacteria bacterium]
ESTTPQPIKSYSGEHVVANTSSLGCVQCHMPVVKRALVKDGKIRQTRHHYWRGGHDPEMVKKALTIKFSELNLINNTSSSQGKRQFTLTIENTGAAHYVPTGTPDRHLTVQLRVVDKKNNVLTENTNIIRRNVMWRPFIIDLKDTRLPRGQPRSYDIEISDSQKAVSVEAVVRYHLLDEKRRKRIAYENKTPIAYDVFRKKITLDIK